jgi:hypothetical protein
MPKTPRLFRRAAPLVAVVTLSILDPLAARAMPFYPPQVSLIVPAASGCGLGVRRGPLDGCDPLYYAGYGSGYRNNYYTGFVSRGVCNGRGTHLACNFYGICWVACN